MKTIQILKESMMVTVNRTPNRMSSDEIEFWKKNYFIAIEMFRMAPSIRPVMVNYDMEVVDTPHQYAAIFADASVDELRASINRFIERGQYQETIPDTRCDE